MTSDRDVLGAVADAVATVIERHGYQPDCILGTRLAISSLRALGIPARPVATSLIVADSTATSAARGGTLEGQILRIGQGSEAKYADRWDGHLVAVAQTDEGSLLVDTTFQQLAKHAFAAGIIGGARVLVLRLPSQWPSVDRDYEFPLNGGTICYRHEPQLEWKTEPGWNHPELNKMVDEVLARTHVKPDRAGH